MTQNNAGSVKSLDDLKSLLAKMTLEEKAGQLNQPPNLDDITDQDIRDGKIGSVICAHSAFAGNEKQAGVRIELINRLQRLAVEESRLGIPILYARDVIHGYRTVAPIPLGQGASFSPEHVKKAQEVAAKEATADGIRWTFTPMLDIGRDPRWGRVAEGFGEDPYLTSILGEAAVEGIQSSGKMAACFKHFAGYGSAEGGRDYNSGEITEHTFRNVYLRPFEAAVKAGCLTGMAAFLETNGEPATCNPWLLDTVLRKEWGFDGPVVSDWNGVGEIVCHGRANDLLEATEFAMTAGTDIDMATSAYLTQIPMLVQVGILREEIVDRAVWRVLKLKFDLGLFENPYVDEAASQAQQFTKESQETTLELTRRTLVLLKNSSDLLPLKGNAKIVLSGNLASARSELFGTWTLDGVAEDVVTIDEALRRELGEKAQIAYTNLPDEAVSFARGSDVAILVLGESPHRSGENNCVADIGLPPGQIELVKAVKRLGCPVVAVVLAGRALDLSELEKEADAILFAFHPGVMGGIAIAETLVGKNNPSGKLPMTFPRSVGQIPIYYNRKATGRPTNPLNRAEARLVDSLDAPLYPFGYGLSYSKIEYSNARLKGWTVTVDVTNTSEIDGEEVVQLYLRDEVASKVRPVRELIKFQRMLLLARETITISFELNKDDLGYYVGPNWTVEPGWFSLAIGKDSDCPWFARFRIDDQHEIINIESLA